MTLVFIYGYFVSLALLQFVTDSERLSVFNPLFLCKFDITKYYRKNYDALCTKSARGRPNFYRAMHFSAKRGIEIAYRLSVCP